jgi:phosphate transport system protein
VREMIVLSVGSLELHDKNAATKLYQMDDTVDALYRQYLRELIAQQNDERKRVTDARCSCCSTKNTKFTMSVTSHILVFRLYGYSTIRVICS